MGKLYAFSGAHGTGKTTSVYAFAAELKRDGEGDVAVLMETARRCPLPVFGVGSMSSRDAQRWIFCEQMRREMNAVIQNDITVSDRTVVDAIAYSLLLGFEDLAADQMTLAKHHIGIYDVVFFNMICGPPANDNFRSTDAAMQRECERIMRNIYRTLNLPVIEIRMKMEGKFNGSADLYSDSKERMRAGGPVPVPGMLRGGNV
ncbi:MAG: AAA family ATPase [Desulfobacterales bacterium]|jgi:predicted ATPase|nr:AAA family ATPase [Desulfobacterales bacterium]